MSRWIAIALAAPLSGCGTYLPELTSQETLPLEVLVAKIDCEFQVAVWVQKHVKHRTFLKGWQGQYAVTLKSNEIGSAKATTNTFPFLPTKNLAVNAIVGGGATTTANRTALMKFNLSFDSVKQEPICAKLQSNSLHPFITGRIGFEEWMDRAFTGADRGGQVGIGHSQPVSSLGHTFEFSIDINANAGAGFVVGPAPTIGINPAATIDRLDDGIVDVAIAKPAVDPLPAVITGLTKADEALAAELEALIKELQKKVAARNDMIQKSPLAKQLFSLDSKTIQSLSQGDEPKLQPFNVRPNEVEQLKALNDLRDANNTDQQEILKYLKQKADIQPKVQAVTTTFHVLAPDRNPEIANTFQQLTLERLNNNLRVPVQ